MDEKSRQFNKLFYNLSRIIIWLFFKIFFLLKIKIVKFEEIPETGAAVIVASHKSWLDILLLCLINPRNIHYIAKIELYKSKIAKLYFDATGVIGIKRGEKDPEAIAKIVETLKQGEIVAIYPEGTRFKGDGIGELNNGIAVMLLRNKVYPPIYPVVITYEKGSFLGLPLKINIIVGEKIIPSNHQSVKVLMEEIRQTLTDLNKKSKIFISS